MGRRGPPKKPTELKKLQGVPGGEHKLQKGEPKPKLVTTLDPPEWLSGKALEVWHEYGPKLIALNLLTELDIKEFARYCDVSARWMDAREVLERDGPTMAVYDRMSTKQREAGMKPLILRYQKRPEAELYTTLSGELNRLASYFGLTPAARAGIGAPSVTNTGDSFKKKLYRVA